MTETTRDLTRAVARFSESMKAVTASYATVGESMMKTLRAYEGLMGAVSAPPTADERLYARRAGRAARRSLRNQPPRR